jgi:hypothetical protein
MVTGREFGIGFSIHAPPVFWTQSGLLIGTQVSFGQTLDTPKTGEFVGIWHW